MKYADRHTLYMNSKPEDVRPWSDLADTGLLWLINRSLLQPRGYTLAFLDDGTDGWMLVGTGREPWRFGADVDEDAKFAAVEALFQESRKCPSSPSSVRSGPTAAGAETSPPSRPPSAHEPAPDQSSSGGSVSSTLTSTKAGTSKTMPTSSGLSNGTQAAETTSEGEG